MRRFREFRLEFGMIVLVAGLIFTILGIWNFFLPSVAPSEPDFIYDLIRNKIGNWIIWVLFWGPILLIAGLFYVGDTVKKYREFEKLMNIDSKAKFVQNQDRIEYLAWLLSARLERRVQEKKKEFKMD